MTASEIAQKLNSSLSTTHRLAMALVAHGLLSRSHDGRFAPGIRFDSSRLAIAARPALARLRDATSETAQLWARRGDSRVCVEIAEALHELRVFLPSGWLLPLSEGGSAGRVLRGEPTQRAAATSTGWIESVSQRTVGLGSVSAPVRVGDEIVATVGIVAPLPRIATTPGEQWGDLVVETADELGTLLSQ